MAGLQPGTFCPLIKDECVGLKCAWYNNVRGTHPQTGAEVEEWRCSVALLPFLLINAAQETRGAAGAVESLRNEVTGGVPQALIEAFSRRRIEAIGHGS